MKQIVLIALLAACNIYAHEFIIKPNQTDGVVGQKIPFCVQVTHRYMISEEIEDSAYVDIALFEKGKKGPESKLFVNESFLTLDGTVTPAQKGAAIIPGHRRPVAWSKTTQGWQVGNRKTLKGVLESNLYEKFAKALITVDDDDTGFDAVVGDRLEIVPAASPAKCKVGDKLSFKVLFDGKPLATEVKAVYHGFSREKDNYTFTGETDKNGIAAVPITSKGLWMVRAENTVPPEDKDMYGKHNIRAVYIFEIR
jgi:uncharacterized GH25 family protein